MQIFNNTYYNLCIYTVCPWNGGTFNKNIIIEFDLRNTKRSYKTIYLLNIECFNSIILVILLYQFLF